MDYQTIRTTYVNDVEWGAIREDGEWLSREWAAKDVASRAGVAVERVTDYREYTIDTHTTDAGQRVRETICILPC